MSQSTPRRAGKIQYVGSYSNGDVFDAFGRISGRLYIFQQRATCLPTPRRATSCCSEPTWPTGSGGWRMRYLAPVLAFVAGVYVAEHIRRVYKDRTDRFLHWRQIVVAIEIVVLFAVGFMPETMNMAANILVSFVCSMQVNAFRKIKGSPYASTMCIGNLRNATASFYAYRHSKDKKILDKCLRYYIVIIIFALGATLGQRPHRAFRR